MPRNSAALEEQRIGERGFPGTALTGQENVSDIRGGVTGHGCRFLSRADARAGRGEGAGQACLARDVTESTSGRRRILSQYRSRAGMGKENSEFASIERGGSGESRRSVASASLWISDESFLMCSLEDCGIVVRAASDFLNSGFNLFRLIQSIARAAAARGIAYENAAFDQLSHIAERRIRGALCKFYVLRR